MRVFFEITGFVAVAVAAHIAVLSPRQIEGLEGAGAQGESLLSIKASTANVAQMVESWENVPELSVETEVVMNTPETAAVEPPVLHEPQVEQVQRMDAPTIEAMPSMDSPTVPDYQQRAPKLMAQVPQMMAQPSIAAPTPPSQPSTSEMAVPDHSAIVPPPLVSAPSAPALPSLERTSPERPPQEKGAVTQSVRPQLRPAELEAQVAPKPKPAAKPKQRAVSKSQNKSQSTKPVTANRSSQASKNSQARLAKGSGGGAAKGNNKKSQTATLSKSQKQSLMAQWGSQIRSRIARRAPRGVGRGTALVTITVSGNGSLLGVRLAKSSGNAKLDKLAVGAVRNAGRFPAAPRKLGIQRHTFQLPVKSR